MVNPWRDEMREEPPVTTPSVEGVRAAGAATASAHRPFSERVAAPVDGSVTHGALYFEDPFEDRGSDDGRFAWNGADYLYLPYGPCRFLLNGGLFPISALVTPPTTVMASDGVISRQAAGAMDHDAARAEAATAAGP